MFVIARPIEGISINGREFVLDSNGRVLEFLNESDAKIFLKNNKVTNRMIKNEGIEIIDESICNIGDDECL